MHPLSHTCISHSFTHASLTQSWPLSLPSLCHIHTAPSLPHTCTLSPPYTRIPYCRHERVIEEPEVIYEASDESDKEEETQRLPVHRIIESDSERCPFLPPLPPFSLLPPPLSQGYLTHNGKVNLPRVQLILTGTPFLQEPSPALFCVLTCHSALQNWEKSRMRFSRNGERRSLNFVAEIRQKDEDL